MWFPDRLRATLWRCRVMVWTAARMVPPADRASWESNQQHRFWHWCHFLAESGQFTPQNRLVIARACWQLFPDAFWLRFDREQSYARVRALIGSPGGLILGLFALTVLLLTATGIVPAARNAFSRPFALADRVALVTLDGSGINGKFSRTRSDTLLDLATIWSKTHLADGIAPFSWGPGTLLLSNRDLPVGTARVGPDFFSILHVKAAFGRTLSADDARYCPDCVMLSHALWQHEFHADPKIVGKQVFLNGNQRMVVGVLPPEFHLVSSGIEVWGLIDPAILFTNFQRRVGAVAHLRDGATAVLLQRDLTNLTENAGYIHPASQIQVVTVEAQGRKNLISTVELLLIATACAVTIVLLRHLSTGIGRLPRSPSSRALWIAFFAGKSALLLALSALTSWTVVHWLAVLIAGSTRPLADEYALWLFLPLAIVVLSWAVRDQQWRCRTCLRRLELPVEIGRTGSVLLNWAGTEMVCPQGHGVLYFPESSSNALDQDRWNKLDDSWQSLFGKE
jgi:hypothetical protein